jgi:hypothetical protein
MARGSAVDDDRDRADAEEARSAVDPCAPLAEQIEFLEEQVATLEDGLPWAPGAQRTALAKEIGERRDELDARRRALRLCRGERH